MKWCVLYSVVRRLRYYSDILNFVSMLLNSRCFFEAEVNWSVLEKFDNFSRLFRKEYDSP